VLRDGEETEITVQLPEMQHMTQAMLNFFGVSMNMTDQGLEITSISEDSPLAQAGFQEGDIITKINGEAVTDGNPLRMLVGTEGKVTFTVLRDGEEIDIDVELPDMFGMGMSGMSARPTQLGVSFMTITADVAKEHNLSLDQGALIADVYEDTPAAKAGLQVDDIVTAVDGDKVDEEHTLADRLAAYEEGDVVTLSVHRGDQDLEIEVTLGPRGIQGGMNMQQGEPFYFFGDGMNGMHDSNAWPMMPQQQQNDSADAGPSA
jgi:S1-C subfamily serine protease